MREALAHPGTSTTAFGVGRRENHDASAFYARFTPPTLSDDDTVASLDFAAAGLEHAGAFGEDLAQQVEVLEVGGGDRVLCQVQLVLLADEVGR